MKKIILFLIFSLSLTFAKSHQNNIFDYAYLASLTNNVDILVSSNIAPENYVFYTNSPYPKISLEVFEKALKLQNLKLAYTGSFYYVYNPADEQSSFEKSVLSKDKNLRYIKLKNNSYDDIASLLSVYDINSTYLYRSNAVTFLSDDFIYSRIKSAIDDIDSVELPQVKFKITILETNLDDLKNKGTDLSSFLDINPFKDFELFVNMITIPYSAQNNIVSGEKRGFYGTLNILENKGITKIVSNPFLVARSNTEVFFSSVQNIPFLKSTTSVTNTEVAENTSYDYKDVGLQVTLKPVVIGNKVDFSLHLIVEDLLSNSNLTPVTSKKELKSSYTLKRGELLVLSGINKTSNVEYTSGIPFLKDIWFIGNLFKIDYKEETNSVLTLTIEVF